MANALTLLLLFSILPRTLFSLLMSYVLLTQSEAGNANLVFESVLFRRLDIAARSTFEHGIVFVFLALIREMKTGYAFGVSWDVFFVVALTNAAVSVVATGYPHPPMATLFVVATTAMAFAASL